ncbi:hypothetical protein DFH09DRAFT_527933, partial [Mycena vulgaris]
SCSSFFSVLWFASRNTIQTRHCQLGFPCFGLHAVSCAGAQTTAFECRRTGSSRRRTRGESSSRLVSLSVPTPRARPSNLKHTFHAAHSYPHAASPLLRSPRSSGAPPPLRAHSARSCAAPFASLPLLASPIPFPALPISLRPRLALGRPARCEGGCVLIVFVACGCGL